MIVNVILDLKSNTAILEEFAACFSAIDSKPGPNKNLRFLTNQYLLRIYVEERLEVILFSFSHEVPKLCEILMDHYDLVRLLT